MKLLEGIRYRRAVAKLKRSGVICTSSVDFISLSGITICRGTWIDDGATIAANALVHTVNWRSRPSGSIRIGERCEIHRGVILASYGGEISIGNNVSINPMGVVYGHGGLSIGDATRIATGVVIIPANHNFENPSEDIKNQGLSKKGVKIGRNVWIGASVKILDGVVIGDNSIIAAGAVVTKDVQSGSIVGGVPARFLRMRPGFTSESLEESELI